MPFDRDIRSTAAGALCGALPCALALALYEAWALIAAGGGGRALIAALAAAALSATLASVAALLCTLATHAALTGLARAGVEWSTALAAPVGASLAVLAAQSLVLVVLSGAGIRAAVVSASAALGVAVGIALAVAARAFAARAHFDLSPRGRTASVVAAGAVTVSLIILLAPGLIEELDVPGLLTLAAPLATGLALATRGVERSAPLRAAIATWVLLACFGAAHVAIELPGGVSRLIARETHASRFVLATFLPAPARTLPPLPPGRGTCTPGAAAVPQPGTRVSARAGAPDIVLIVVDAMRWDHTTLGGYARDTTPELARRAASAAVFSSAMTPASSTRQTYRSLFTGLHPSQVLPSTAASWWRVSLAPAQATLAELLHAAGYRTVSVTEKGDAFDPKGGALDGFAQRLRAQDGEGRGGEKRAARARSQLDLILNEARAERSEPLFAWTHLQTPHQPYVVGTKSRYGKRDVDLYDWAIQFVDGELGRFLQELEQSGRLASTYVIVTADHGQAFGEHGNRLHGTTVYQEETWVPLLVWGPGVRAGTRDTPVGLIDLFPTILELASTATSRSTCGATLVPWLQEPARASTRDVYLEQVPDKRAYFQVGYVRGRHKLVVTPAEGAIELFDLRSDPAEKRDLAAQKRTLTHELVEALIGYQRERGLDPAAYGL